MASYALLIGISQFSDPKLGRLNAPRSDVEALARVLEDPGRGGFTSVTTCIDQELQVIRDQVASLLDERNPDDLVLLYYSGHGIVTKGQRLFLATGQTLFDRPQARSLAALEMRDMLEQSRAGKQVVILDCCHSGAFGEGSKGAAQAVNPDTFGDSEGQYILTATDALQFAYDSSVASPQEPSRFTGWLVDAIGKGEAAPDSDRITLDAVFDYLSRRARTEAAGMTPKRFVKRSSGEMVIAKNPLAALAALPEEIISGLAANEWQVRRDTVTKLAKLAEQPRYHDLVERGITDRIGLERDVDVRAAMLALLRKLGSDAPAAPNPAGQSAPGLPQHDVPAVSHPAAQAAPGPPRADAPLSDPPTGQNAASGGGVEKRLPDTAVTRSRSSRAQLFSGITVLLSSPIQVVLYPIAGSAGLFAGVTIYLLTYYFMRWDAVASEVVSALAVLAFTLERLPVEFRFAESHPLYPKIRHWIRLALVTGGVVSLLMLSYAEDAKEFPELEDQTSSFGSLVNLVFGFSMMAAVLVVVPMHFVLRWVAARRVWDGIIQTVLDLRKA